MLRAQKQAPVMTQEQVQLQREMDTYESALKAAKTKEEKNNILEAQKQTIIKAKKNRANSKRVDQVAAEVAAFNAALNAAKTPEEKQAIILAEQKAMTKPASIRAARTAEQTKFEAEMTNLDVAYATARTPAEKQTIVEKQRQTIVKAKQNKLQYLTRAKKKKVLTF
jgi:hypothetical protein